MNFSKYIIVEFVSKDLIDGSVFKLSIKHVMTVLFVTVLPFKAVEFFMDDGLSSISLSVVNEILVVSIMLCVLVGVLAWAAIVVVGLYFEHKDYTDIIFRRIGEPPLE